MNDGTVEIRKQGNVIDLTIESLRARYRFSSEDDCRQAEMLAEQIALAYGEKGGAH